ncbi:MAG: hypothetical protein MUC96_32110 [Myxococcaceae bacterium]|nr:hypothetical protein [Myxococcaceae bacterium]
MSRKLLIVIGVQSALVLGLGGAALGLSLSGGGEAPAHAKAKKKKAKAPPVEEDVEDDEAHDEADAEEPSAAKAKPARKARVAHSPEPLTEEAAAEPPAVPHAAAKTQAHEAESKGGTKPKAAAAPTKAGADAHADPHVDELHPLPAAPKEPLEALAWLDEGNARWAQGVSRSRDVVRPSWWPASRPGAWWLRAPTVAWCPRPCSTCLRGRSSRSRPRCSRPTQPS